MTISALAVPAIATSGKRLAEPVAVLQRHRDYPFRSPSPALLRNSQAGLGPATRRDDPAAAPGLALFVPGLRPIRIRLRHHRNIYLRHGARRSAVAARRTVGMAVRRPHRGAVGTPLELGRPSLGQPERLCGGVPARSGRCRAKRSRAAVSGTCSWQPALLGGTFVGLTAIGLVHVRHMSGGNPRRNLALMTAAFGLGQMVGPTLTGVLYDSLGSYPAAIAVGCNGAPRRRVSGRPPGGDCQLTNGV